MSAFATIWDRKQDDEPGRSVTLWSPTANPVNIRKPGMLIAEMKTTSQCDGPPQEANIEHLGMESEMRKKELASVTVAIEKDCKSAHGVSEKLNDSERTLKNTGEDIDGLTELTTLTQECLLTKGELPLERETSNIYEPLHIIIPEEGYNFWNFDVTSSDNIPVLKLANLN